jgi:hypothetical protein
MLKKIAYFYLIIAVLSLLLMLLGGALDSVVDFAFLLFGVGGIFLMFLIWTSPIWLIVLVLVFAGGSLRRLLVQAEEFHTGGNRRPR